jgi:hypothetical protein
MILGADDKILTNSPGGTKAFSVLLSQLLRREIAKSDLVEPGFVNKVVSIQSLALERFDEPHSVVKVCESANLDGITYGCQPSVRYGLQRNRRSGTSFSAPGHWHKEKKSNEDAVPSTLKNNEMS